MSRGFDWNNTAGVHWSKQENDFMCGAQTKATGALLAFDFIGSDDVKNLLAELDKRGYDLETLRFSVKKKSNVVDESLYEKVERAKKLTNPIRNILLLSVKKTLEEKNNTDCRLYDEVSRLI